MDEGQIVLRIRFAEFVCQRRRDAALHFSSGCLCESEDEKLVDIDAAFHVACDARDAFGEDCGLAASCSS